MLNLSFQIMVKFLQYKQIKYKSDFEQKNQSFRILDIIRFFSRLFYRYIYMY